MLFYLDLSCSCAKFSKVLSFTIAQWEENGYVSHCLSSPWPGFNSRGHGGVFQRASFLDDHAWLQAESLLMRRLGKRHQKLGRPISSPLLTLGRVPAGHPLTPDSCVMETQQKRCILINEPYMAAVKSPFLSYIIISITGILQHLWVTNHSKKLAIQIQFRSTRTNYNVVRLFHTKRFF